MNLRIVDPSITWEDTHELMEENQYKIFLDQLLEAKKIILNNYVERVFVG